MNLKLTLRAGMVPVTSIAVLALSLGAGNDPALGASSTAAATTPSAAVSAPSTTPAPALAPDAVVNDDAFGPGWRKTADRIVTTAGDEAGFHVLVADAADGYAWHTAASLSEPTFEADQWIGQVCVTESARFAGVVYAPRTFANREALMYEGAFGAVVNLETGAVTKLAERVSLAYFNPACGAGDSVSFSRLEQRVDEPAATSIVKVSAPTGAVDVAVDIAGQVTSPVWDGSQFVGALGSSLVAVGRDGRVTELARHDGVPFRLTVDKARGTAYQVLDGEQVEVRRFAAGADTLIGSAPKGAVRLSGGVGASVALTGPGAADVTGRRALPAGWRAHNDVPADAELSSHGLLAVTSATNREEAAGKVDLAPGDGMADRVFITALSTHTDEQVDFSVAPVPAASGGTAPSPSLDNLGTTPSNNRQLASLDPEPHPEYADISWDPDRTCEVQRNDPRIQVYQPTPKMVEWAADLAVRGMLTPNRPNNANMTALGLGNWTPQGMFPSTPLVGGGRVPAQILLGILAQESNMWHASNHAADATAGNFHQGGFYGNGGNVRTVNWDNADCGYGVAQITTGMELDDTTRFTPTQKLALTVDYATNIAAGLQILQEKWNQTRSAGLMVNNGDPQYLENWWFAVWAYNSGFYPQGQDASGQWGVGWANNPANPIYEPDREMFLQETYDDAKTPNKWSYPERVLGWAATSLIRLDFSAPGVSKPYTSTYLTGNWPDDDPAAAQPDLTTFCSTAVNECTPGALEQPEEYPSQPPGPCTRDDLKCWWHVPITWADCAVECGTEVLRYQTLNPAPVANNPYPANCSRAGLPSSALIVDDVPSTVKAAVGCAAWGATQGTFDLRFNSNHDGDLELYHYYPSKVDFHQIGGGFGGHFWFAHTRTAERRDLSMKVSGTWTLGRQLTGWTRVLVHMPNVGAHTQQATYEIAMGDGRTEKRTLLQRTRQNRWVSLGVMRMAGTPSVTLTSVTKDGDGVEDVAFDAVAFVPLPAKPEHFVVSMGDSYSSGIGASNDGHSDYYFVESNNNGSNEHRNACHRSKEGWPLKMVLEPGTPTIGERIATGFAGNYVEDWHDPNVDFHFTACSGAQTENIFPEPAPGDPDPPENANGQTGRGQYRELSQIERGFLNEDTTLVTISIGGNDARFGRILWSCGLDTIETDCMDVPLDEGGTRPAGETVPEQILGPVITSIQLTIQQIHEHAPNAKIMLVGYPRLFDTSQSCVVAAFSYDEKVWMNEMADLLTSTMESRAELMRTHEFGSIPVYFTDPRPAFDGAGVCAPEEAIHGVVSNVPLQTEGDLPDRAASDESFHPNMIGSFLYAASVNEALWTEAVP